MLKGCLVCGKEFEAKNYWQKYCKSTCKQAMWAKNKFEKKEYTHVFKFKDGETPILNDYVPNRDDIYAVKVIFYYPVVNRLYAKTKKMIARGEKIYCDTVPDLDNGIRPVLNRLTGKIWIDDRKIVKLTIEKFFSEISQSPDIEVKVLC